MQGQNIQKETTDIITFSVSLEKRSDVVGYIYYDTKSLQWSFEYHALFSTSRFTPIGSFPDTTIKYGHMDVVTWLMSRIAENSDIKDMKIIIRENIKLRDNRNVSYRLEVLHIQ